MADPSVSNKQMRDSDCTNDKIDLYRKVYKVLRSELKTKVGLNILYNRRDPVPPSPLLVLHHKT